MKARREKKKEKRGTVCLAALQGSLKQHFTGNEKEALAGAVSSLDFSAAFCTIFKRSLELFRLGMNNVQWKFRCLYVFVMHNG